MVKTVHPDNWLTVNLCDVRTLFDFNFMHKDGPFVARIIMIKCVGKLVRDVSIQSPAKSYIHYLTTAADTEERLAIRGGRVYEVQFNGITGQIHIINAWMPLAGIMLERNVSPAGEENPV